MAGIIPKSRPWVTELCTLLPCRLRGVEFDLNVFIPFTVIVPLGPEVPLSIPPAWRLPILCKQPKVASLQTCTDPCGYSMSAYHPPVGWTKASGNARMTGVTLRLKSSKTWNRGSRMVMLLPNLHCSDKTCCASCIKYVVGR